MADYYDRSGQPITLEEWERLFFGGAGVQSMSYRQVASDEIGDSRVSTVWLGLNHNWYGDGPPIIFETMVFGGPMHQEQQRYATEQEALAGHKAIVDQLTGKA